jgi:PleD family two-component response regulator
MLTAHADNIERLYSYRHVDGYPMLVAVALSKQEILANWRADTWRNGGALVLLVAALALLGYRLIHHLRMREKLTVQLRDAKQALEARNESLAALALHDGLTGLANRRQFDAVFSAEFSRAMRGGEELAVLLPRTDAAGAMAVTEKMRLAVRDLHIPHAGTPAGIVTISAGVAACVPCRGGRDRVSCHEALLAA